MWDVFRVGLVGKPDKRDQSQKSCFSLYYVLPMAGPMTQAVNNGGEQSRNLPSYKAEHIDSRRRGVFLLLFFLFLLPFIFFFFVFFFFLFFFFFIRAGDHTLHRVID